MKIQPTSEMAHHNYSKNDECNKWFICTTHVLCNSCEIWTGHEPIVSIINHKIKVHDGCIYKVHDDYYKS